MGVWSGPFLIATLLLAAAGVSKLIDPTMTVGALRASGIRVPEGAVRAVGGAEALLAIVDGVFVVASLGIYAFM